MTNFIRKAFQKAKNYLLGIYFGRSNGEDVSSDDMSRRSLLDETRRFSLENAKIGSSVRVSYNARKRVLSSFEQSAIDFLVDELGFKCDKEISENIQNFFRSLDSNPARNYSSGWGGGATGDRQNLWLHLIARCLDPTVIVESGVGAGRSLYTLRKAVPSAELYAFDTSFDSLIYESDNVNYKNFDWRKSSVKCHNRKGLCYFDDHINNGLRIRQAYDRGFKHLVFDDCPRVPSVHHYRYPGIPTAMMIWNDELESGDIVEYKWKEFNLRYKHKKEYEHGSKDLIKKCLYIPRLLEGNIGARHCAYVELH